ncbi:MAG TPA: galactose oxidase-like domain-containing protein [Meiothermus sp.]|nr:galactose oxidase-like domain-containing protein [Meiothermus sp.]
MHSRNPSPNPNLAPPGYYMLFLLDSQSTSSVAKILKIQ